MSKKLPAKASIITVRDVDIRISKHEMDDYLCITDIAKYVGPRTDIVISNWLRNRNTVEFLGLWEQLHNDNFNTIEFDGIRMKTGLNDFFLTTKQWTEKTNAIGIEARAGRYGGTYAHKDIALEFMSFINPSFRLYFIKEFQRLKEAEAERNNYQLQWTVRRELSKINYHLHLDTVKQLMPRKLDEKGKRFVYANEADLLNLALFGVSAAQWRDENPDKKGNIRDYATIEQLTVLVNLENLNAEYLKAGLEPDERIQLLNERAIEQMDFLLRYEAARNLKGLDEGELQLLPSEEE